MTGTILVIDDEKLIRWSVKEKLQKEGYYVATAADCKEAEKAFRDDTFDIVLCDLKLPDGDGLTLMKKLSKSAPDTQFIIITAFATIENAVEAMKTGAHDYIQKPFNMDELILKVNRAMQSISIKTELKYLMKESKEGFTLDSIIAKSSKMKEILGLVKRVAKSEAQTVLLIGESGVGKDLIAKALHYNSSRANKQFVNITCTAIPDSLLESELFGHEKGSFTDAQEQKKGLLEIADGGTVFLDEIGDMPLTLQAKLLRFLEEKAFRRVGGTFDIRVNARVIAATNKDIQKLVEEGKFREDLFYRLSVIVVNIPPLRERREDIAYLTIHFIDRFNGSLKKNIKGAEPEALALLKSHNWPGNVRELRNVIERAVLLCQQDWISNEDIMFTPNIMEGDKGKKLVGKLQITPGGTSLEEVEKQLVLQALTASGWNQSKAARMLSISRDQIRYKMVKYNLKEV